MSPAAARFRISPVIEIAFGVSRDSISRLRAYPRHSAAVRGCGRSLAMRRRYLDSDQMVASVVESSPRQDQTSGRRRAS